MRRGLPLAACAALIVLFVPPAFAQEGPRPERRAGMSYYTMVLFDFKPGMEQQAFQFGMEHFAPVSAEAGVPREMAFVGLTGEWDLILFDPLPEGPDALAWEVTETGAKWMAALAAREGGMEQARQRFEEFNAMVARSKVELVMRPTGE